VAYCEQIWQLVIAIHNKETRQKWMQFVRIKSNLELSYNLLNLPSVVSQSSTEIASYGWFADASKFSVLTPERDGYYYIGSLIYASRLQAISNTWTTVQGCTTARSQDGLCRIRSARSIMPTVLTTIV
jgi:hypothetical protein